MRNLLLVISILIFLPAAVTGALMMIFPDGAFLGMSLSVLDGSPFNSYFIPGSILAIFVAGTGITAICYLLAKHRDQYNWALAAGVVLVLWMITEMILLDHTTWLQWLFLGTGVIITLMAFQLKGKWLA